MLLGIAILLSKAKNAASKALTQKVLYRKRFEQGKHLLAGFTAQTNAPAPEVMRQLETRGSRRSTFRSHSVPLRLRDYGGLTLDHLLGHAGEGGES